MTKNTILLALLGFSLTTLCFSCTSSKKENKTETGTITAGEEGEEGENDKYDGPLEMARREWEMTKDPALNKVPRYRLVNALRYADNLRNIFSRMTMAGAWTERGPNSDTVGPSNGNTRANSGITSGRMRAVLVDAADASGNTVWVGGVNGGLWKTTDITASPATWSLQSDFFSNMSITSMCQNPSTPATMYFATGEWTFNADAVAGDGIWKSTNGGVTWAQLPSTTGSSFDFCSKILCDNSGNVYVTTLSGVFRSTDGGSTWTTITPSGLGTSRFSDMELSTTGRLHVSSGQFSTCAYRYTDNPSTVTSGTWTSATSGYPTSSVRIELACSGNTLIALPSNGSYQVPTLYKSTDGGATWAATTGQPTSGWASGQAWYALSADIDPSNTDNMIVGGLEPYKSTDGGVSWTRIARWVGTTGQYVHADIHYLKLYGTNRILFGCDGGIHFSSDGGTTIRDRNVGLRIKQFYSCDIHPTNTNYLVAGAQDNGCHRLRTAGLAGSQEVIGGDGGFMRIDQNEPTYQFGSYVYNTYRRSTNDGNNWSTITFYRGSPGTYNSTYFDFGAFINQWEYDDAGNAIYGPGSTTNEFFRWTSPQTTAAGTYYSNTSFASANAELVSFSTLGSTSVTAVHVSPYTANRVYFGSSNRKIVYLDNANTAASPATGVDISSASFNSGATVSCINTGTNDNNLIASFSNYGVNNIWVSTNGGTSWTAIDGNLPDMPVRWCMFYPGDNTKAIIATEAGVWITELINGGSTSWYVSATFPLVRTDMLRYRASDGMIVAATHGRGLWTQTATTVLPLNSFTLSGSYDGSSQANLNWFYEMASSNTKFELQVSTDGSRFTRAGDISFNGTKNYRFTHLPPASKVYYRIRAIEHNEISRYSNIIRLDRNGSAGMLTVQASPNPAGPSVMLQYSANEKGQATFSILDNSGKAVLTRRENIAASGAYATPWDISRVSPGIYTLVMRLNGAQASQKLVKQ